MSRYFTQAQIDEIQQRIATRTVRDSDFVDSESLTGEEYIPILQEGVNKKMPLTDFADKVADKAIIVGPGEFILHDDTGTDMLGGMTQHAITVELNKKMEIGDVVLYDNLGDNTDGAMTQAFATQALAGKMDVGDVKLYDETGDNVDGAMTQAAVTSALSNASVSESKILNVLEELSFQEIVSLLDL